ncbi:MAG: hypothetical protein Ta2A_09700 [Treponemataceae bacterium]|nr:MAG: hypothetical protein Ta2A_09700 [Treponemataceae bacterium]
MEKKCVSVLCIVLFMAISASCTKKESATNSQIEPVYVFDIESFTYFDEFPATIDEIKKRYPDELFKEDIEESTGPMGHFGKYAYDFVSPNIRFIFWGNSEDEAELHVVKVLTALYQNPSIQVIGMTKEELIEVMGVIKYRIPDNDVIINSDDESYLAIRMTNGIVSSYDIIR